MICGHTFSGESKITAELARLAVSIEYQHKGYGNYLIGSAVEKLILISENVSIIWSTG